MVQRRQRDRSLFEVLLPDGHKLSPDWLRKIDTLLEDEAVTETVAQGLDTSRKSTWRFAFDCVAIAAYTCTERSWTTSARA